MQHFCWAHLLGIIAVFCVSMHNGRHSGNTTQRPPLWQLILFTLLSSIHNPPLEIRSGPARDSDQPVWESQFSVPKFKSCPGRGIGLQIAGGYPRIFELASRPVTNSTFILPSHHQTFTSPPSPSHNQRSPPQKNASNPQYLHWTRVCWGCCVYG